MIKHLPLKTLENIAQTIQTSLQLGHVPAQWKISTITMIPKVGKDHKTLKGYRLLSLIFCLGKLCESIVNKHLVNHCEKLNLFGDQQSAFRSGRCTTDNLLTLTGKATTSFKWKGATAAAFFDVEQAFDSVWHEGILYKQIEIKIPWLITKWTSSFLSNRKIKVKYNQALSKSFTTEAGVPQGSIISPISFNVYVSKPKCKDTSISQYADNIAIYYTHEKQEIATKHLQIAIKHLEKWCEKWKIVLNAGKTIYTIFTRQILNTNLRLSLGSEDINVSKEVKFLGHDLNYKLTRTKHVNKIVAKMQQRMNMLGHLKSKNITPNFIMYLYKTMVRPLYMYANAAWANVTKSDLNKIQREQNKAIRLAYNLPMWTNLDELHQIGNLEIVSRTIQKLSSEYLARTIKRNKNSKNITEKHLITWSQVKMFQTPLQNIL